MSLCQPVKPEGTLWVNQRQSSANTPSGRGPAKGAKASREREMADVRGEKNSEDGSQYEKMKKDTQNNNKKKGFWCEGEDALYRKEKRVTLTVISPPDCVFFLVLKIQSHIEVQALCLWSAPTQYHFRPVGVIVVQLTEQREADSES